MSLIFKWSLTLKNSEGYHVVYFRIPLPSQKLFYAKKRIGGRDQIFSIAQSILISCVQSLAESFFLNKIFECCALRVSVNTSD